MREPSPQDQERENSPELGEERPEEKPLLREETPTRKESPLEEPQLREESPLEEDFSEEERPIKEPPEVGLNLGGSYSSSSVVIGRFLTPFLSFCGLVTNVLWIPFFVFASWLTVFFCSLMPSKERDVALDVSELDLSNPYHLSPVGFRAGEEEEEEDEEERRDQKEETNEGVPWEKRYEKIWVEVEKREVKTCYRNVTAELKEKFGELVESEAGKTSWEDCPEDLDEQVEAAGGSAESSSSDEDEGEPVLRPTARARSTVLLTIPEQRESGLEDSQTESADNSLREDRPKPGNHQPGNHQPAPSAGTRGGGTPRLVGDDASADQHREKSRSPSPAGGSCTRGHNSTNVFQDPNTEPKPTTTNVDSSLTNRETKHEPEPDLASSPEPACGLRGTDQEFSSSSEEDPEDTPSKPPVLSAGPTAPSGVSDEELEEGLQRFRQEVGMLKVVFLDLEKEKALLQNEVEDDRPHSCSACHSTFTSLSLCFCLSLSLCFCLSHSHSLSVSVSLSLSLCFCLSHSLSLSLCFCLPFHGLS